jgi:hypothetical protein
MFKKTNKLTDLKIFCKHHFIQDEEKEIFNNLVNNTDLEENEMLDFLFSGKSKFLFYVRIKKQQAIMIGLYIKNYR